jgi:HSP20 family protein
MTLVKFEPFREFENIHDKIQRYFEDFSNIGLNLSDNFNPRIDISDDKDNITVSAEIPGVKKEDVKVTLQDNILTIEGEKKNINEKKDKNFYRSERSFGSFKRSFTLSVDVDSEKVEASFDDGILDVQMKKLEHKSISEKVIELK